MLYDTPFGKIYSDQPVLESGYPQDVEDFILSEHKKNKKKEVGESFEREFKYRAFVSSLGFNCDNRRYGSKNDRDNLQALIDIEVEPILWKDADGVDRSITLADAEVLKKEMAIDGLSRYQIKWVKEKSIDAALTKDELDLISWE